MAFRDDFAEITRLQEPLAPYTWLRIGGPAEYFVLPRNRQEMVAVVQACGREKIPLRMLGGGCNLLIRDEGVSGVVMRLSAPEFTSIQVEGKRIWAASGTPLSRVISEAAEHNLAGFETLVGIRGTVGGALQCNAGDRTGEIGERVRRVEVLDAGGNVQIRDRSEMHFTEHKSDIIDPVIVRIEFELETDSVDAIVKRMLRSWIQRKATQPFSFQAAVRAFRNPRGHQAATLIEQVGLVKTKVGEAEISDRNANYVVANPGATARDVLRLLDMTASKVREQTGIALEREVLVW